MSCMKRLVLYSILFGIFRSSFALCSSLWQARRGTFLLFSMRPVSCSSASQVIWVPTVGRLLLLSVSSREIQPAISPCNRQTGAAAANNLSQLYMPYTICFMGRHATMSVSLFFYILNSHAIPLSFFWAFRVLKPDIFVFSWLQTGWVLKNRTVMHKNRQAPLLSASCVAYCFK